MQYFGVFFVFVAFCFFISVNAEVDDTINAHPSVDGNRVTLNDTQYFFSLSKMSWYAATLYCDQNMGMRLGSVQTEEKYKMIIDHIKADPVMRNGYVLTGGIRASHSSQWIWWPIKETFTYTNWESIYYPGYKWYQQACAMISGTFGDWIDSGCSISSYFFCEEI